MNNIVLLVQDKIVTVIELVNSGRTITYVAPIARRHDNMISLLCQ